MVKAKNNPISLQVDYAWCSEAGAKSENADVCDARVPEGNTLNTKGVAAAIADGMSASEGGREAAEVCITNFLTDYYSTPDSWTTRTAGGKVLGAVNRWLCGQGQTLYDSPKGMVTTFSGLVIKSSTAHIFHVGDSRIYLYRNHELEQLTCDHRVWISSDRELLSRAIGVEPHLDIDYRSLAINVGDVLLFTTDGVHGYMTNKELLQNFNTSDCNLQSCSNKIVEQALANGSSDNVTCQLVQVLGLPQETEDDIYQTLTELPLPPTLMPGMKIDGYEILRELHSSKRSEVFLAMDIQNQRKVVLKTPSSNYRDDPEFLDSFLHEEWVGQRINNPHILQLLKPKDRRFMYNISEYISGKDLAQWQSDNGLASLETVRDFANQIALGLRALHRQEIYHQDLKPANIFIDTHGTLKLIDFGSSRIAGLEEIGATLEKHVAKGTLNYSAPECIRGERCTKQSDLYSLAVIVYELLTGNLPYGETDRPNSSRKPTYITATQHNPEIPLWVDGAIAKAVHPVAGQRHKVLSEFLRDLNQPNAKFQNVDNTPLLERNPVAFWKWVSWLSILINLALFYKLT